MLDFASLEATLLEYHDVKFVAHGQMFWKHISADGVDRKEMYPNGQIVVDGVIWRLLKEYPNLYADISATSGFNALKRDAENAKRFLSLFQDKILYGTDGLMAGQREFLKSLELSKEALDKIFGDNAKNLISLS
jgi:predicted TIM-barrel fold metal-dependent hydrolase